MNYPCLTTNGKACLSILGGMLMTLVLGSFYLWGTLNLYVASYLKYFDPSFHLEKSFIIFPIMSISFHAAVPLAIRVCSKIGFRFHMFLCLLGFCMAYFFATATPSFWGFFFIYGFLSGFSAGLTYLIPLYNAYKYFPMRRGLAGGLIVGAYGFGSMVSSPILISLLNPENAPAVEDVNDGNYYFGLEVIQNLNYSLRILAGFFLVVGTLGIILCVEYEEEEEYVCSLEDINENTQALVVELREHDHEDEDVHPSHSENGNSRELEHHRESKVSHISKISQFAKRVKASVFNSKIGKWSKATINPEDETQCKSLSEALKSTLFWELLAMFTLSCSSGFFVAANYKNLGILEIRDDSFLTMVGSVGAVSNGVGRVVWGLIMDRYQFHKSFLILLILQLLEGFALRLLLPFKFSYLFLVMVAFFTLGGHTVLFPTFCIKCFGAKIGAEAYGMLFWGMCLGNLLQTVVVLVLKSSLGFENLRFVFLFGTAFCLAILKWRKLKF